MTATPSSVASWQCLLTLLLAASTIGCGAADDGERSEHVAHSLLQPGAVIESNDESDLVGGIAGSLAVGDSGTASYSVPIELPDGRAGHAPGLAISYSSSASDGLVGVGWGLAGFSSITRCGPRHAADGVNDVVRFGIDDRLCLDGEALVPETGQGSNNYWSQTVYRLRSNPLVRVTRESAAVGHYAFRVEHPNGSVSTYRFPGAVTPQRRLGDPTTGALGTLAAATAEWPIARSQDASGNYIDYTWGVVASSESVELYPSEVRYTGFVGNSGAQAQAPDRRVTFEYATRRDKQQRWVSGQVTRRTRRIQSITVRAPDETGSLHRIRRYHLSYVPYGDNDFMSRLSAIRVCDESDLCLPTTQFSYAAPDFQRNGFVNIRSNIDDSSTIRNISMSRRDSRHGHGPRLLDLDADGRDELVFSRWVDHASCPLIGMGASDGFWYRRFDASTSDFSAERRIALDVSGRMGAVRVVDANGDGKVDFLHTKCDTNDAYQGGHRFRLGVGLDSSGVAQYSSGGYEGSSPFAPPVRSQWIGDMWGLLNVQAGDISNSKLVSADFNGDAITDYFAMTYLNDPTRKEFSGGLRLGGSSSLADYLTNDATRERYLGSAIDVDGNGSMELLVGARQGFTDRVEFLGVNRMNDELYTRRLNLPRRPTAQGYSHQSQLGAEIFIDINSDGITDHCDLSATMTLGAGKPNSFVCSMGTGVGFGAQFPALESAFLVSGDNDASFVSDGWAFHSQYGTIDTGVRVVDINGDGRDDILLPQESDYSTDLWLFRVYVSNGETFRSLTVPAPGLFDSTSMPDGFAQIMTGDVDGDGALDIVYPANEGSWNGWRVLRYLEQPSVLLTNIVEGDGAHHQIEYANLRPGDVGGHTLYEPASVPLQYPQRPIIRGGYVVRRHGTDSGAGDGEPVRMRWRRHAYHDGRIDVRNRVNLGFASHSIFDEDRGDEYQIHMNNAEVSSGEFLLAGIPYLTVHAAKIGYEQWRIATASRAYEIARPYGNVRFAQQSSVTERDFDATSWDGSVPWGTPPFRWVETETPKDSLGFTLSSRVSSSEGDVTTSVQTFEHRTSGVWIWGLVRSTTVTSTAPVRTDAGTSIQDAATVRSERTFDSAGRLSSIVVQPGIPAEAHTRTYEYTATGQLAAVVESESSGLQHRRTTFAYESAGGAHVTAVTNPEGQTESRTVHPGLGVVLRTVDVGGRSTSADYDQLGRLRESRNEDGHVVSRSYRRGTTRVPLVITTEDNTGGRTRQYVDRIGRVVKELTRAPGEREVRSRHFFDHLGRLTGEEVPAFEGLEHHGFANFQYDGLDRPTRIERPDGRETTFLYTSLTMTMFAPGAPPRVTTLDGLGRRVEATEQVRGAPEIVRYDYGAFGRLARIDDARGALIRSTYDSLGRVVAEWTPEGGATTVSYNGFGDVVSVADVVRGTTSYTYDRLGRRTSANNTIDGASVFAYDTAINGVGQIAFASSADGAEVSFEYDALGRQRREQWRIEAEQFSYDFHYDGLGRIAEVEYPHDGVGPRFALEYQYGTSGEVRRVADADSGVTYWRYLESDAAGRLTEFELGEGIHTSHTFDAESEQLVNSTTDVRGALMQTGTVLQDVTYHWTVNDLLDSREDHLASRTDSYTYDDAERLTNWRVAVSAVGANSVVDHAYDYDAIGNLTSLDGVVQRYGEAFSGGSASAVSSVGADASYRYDAAGRRVAGGDRLIEYNRHDLPRRITTGGRTIEYKYGPSGERVLRTSASETTVYAGGAYERRTKVGSPGEPVRHVFKLPGGGQVIRDTVADSNEYTQGTVYVLPDHLGSTEVVVDAEGSVIERRYRDPWGHPTNSASYRIAWTSPPSDVREGYGGHEEEPETRLVDMGGRIYDPVTSRFLSADPFVGSVESRQAYNPYAYVRNRPTTYSDPSGFLENGYQPPIVDPAGGLNIVGAVTTDNPAGYVIGTNSTCLGGQSEYGPVLQTSSGVPYRNSMGCMLGSSSDSDAGGGQVNPETGISSSEPSSPGPSGEAESSGEAAVGGGAELAGAFLDGVGQSLGENAVGIAVGAGLLAVAGLITAPAWVAGCATAGLVALAAAGIASLAGDTANTVADVAQNGLTVENARELGYNLTNIATTVANPEARLGSTVKSATRYANSRIFSRINISSASLQHVYPLHFNSVKRAKSQFAITKERLLQLLRSPAVLDAPPRPLTSRRFAREIDNGTTVGNLPETRGGESTNVWTVITDGHGNLETAFPGTLPESDYLSL